MNLVLSVLEFLFVLLGVAALLRYLVWKLAYDGDARCYWVVPLYNGSAELAIRSALEKNRYEFDRYTCVLFAVDMGLDGEEACACQMISLDHPQVVYCKPEELPDLIRS